MRPTEVTYNAATSACEKAGRWRHALRLLGREVLDVVAFGAAIGACENATAWRRQAQPLVFDSGKHMGASFVS